MWAVFADLASQQRCLRLDMHNRFGAPKTEESGHHFHHFQWFAAQKDVKSLWFRLMMPNAFTMGWFPAN